MTTPRPMDELQGLLASHSSSSEDDAERVSMHSNFGRNRRKKRKEKKKITLFGFDLFGATKRKAKPAPITLGEEDDAIYSSALPDHTRRGGDDDDAGGSRRSGEDPSGSTPSLGTIHTSATFDADSDAAPLSASVIDGLSFSPRALELLTQSALLEEQRLLQAKSEKEERRRKRREKREARYGGKESKETRDGLERERLKLERAKMQGVLPEDGQGEEFEGFQGSGSALPAARLVLGRRSRSGTTGSSSSRTTSRTGEESRESGSRTKEGRREAQGSTDSTGQPVTNPNPTSATLEDFGDFVSVESNGPEEGEADEVDLDGELYAGPRRSYAEHRSARGSSSNGDSKSRGSGQGSQGQTTAPGAHRRTMSRGTNSSHGHVPASPSPLGPHSMQADQLLPTTVTTRKEKKSKSKSSSKKSSRSSGSTSQSTSVASPSPLSPTFGSQGPLSSAFAGEAGKYVSPSTVEQGLGFFDAEDFVPSHTPSPNPSYIPSPNSSLPPPSPFAGSFATANGRSRATSVLETGSGGSSRSGSKRESRSGSVVGVRQGVVGERHYSAVREGFDEDRQVESEGARIEPGGKNGVVGRGRGGSESGFPSTGFGGVKRGGGERRDMVRFLSGGSGEGL
ncbi:hypothetical protein FA13DRAFT_595889 [Coprinellus micaceus]|uniref:Uncharacterized protein n=1 Tax=Coprinellus micaceus TaxID=71717 RepID=A0A4Y7T871_COPMI|nr:hypothetical protein FA13DRAFT_595889 [Coprinellus micaceus]